MQHLKRLRRLPARHPIPMHSRLIGALLASVTLAGCALPGAAVAKCDHACWLNICKGLQRDYKASFAACMRDEHKP